MVKILMEIVGKWGFFEEKNWNLDQKGNVEEN